MKGSDRGLRGAISAGGKRSSSRPGQLLFSGSPGRCQASLASPGRLSGFTFSGDSLALLASRWQRLLALVLLAERKRNSLF